MRAVAVTAGAVLALLAGCFVVGSVLMIRREPVARAAAPSDAETRFLDTRSGRVHLLDLGEGPVILLVLGTYEDIATPVLQVHGSRDASIPIEAARGLTPRLRDARFVVVEGASHDVHIDAPDELVAAIESFELETGSGPARSRQESDPRL